MVQWNNNKINSWLLIKNNGDQRVERKIKKKTRNFWLLEREKSRKNIWEGLLEAVKILRHMEEEWRRITWEKIWRKIQITLVKRFHLTFYLTEKISHVHGLEVYEKLTDLSGSHAVFKLMYERCIKSCVGFQKGMKKLLLTAYKYVLCGWHWRQK